MMRVILVRMDMNYFYYRQHGENLTSNENRILSTRRNIHLDFINNNKISTPRTLAIIPLRNISLNGKLLIENRIGTKSLLQYKIDEVLQSQKIQRIVLTSHDDTIIAYCQEHLEDLNEISIIKRPEKYARHNVSLYETCEYLIKEINENFEAVMILPIEFPFVSGEIIDDAINTLSIFGADSLISVRKEKTTLYQHHGNGMKAILNQDQYTRLEREALYKNVGGILLSTIEAMRTHRQLLSGKVGHIVVDQKAAQSIQTAYDLELSNFINSL